MASLGQREHGRKKQKQKKPLRRVWWDKNTKINKTLPRGLIATIFVLFFFFFCNVILPYGHPRSRLKLGVKVGGWSWGYIGKKLKWSYTPNSYTWNNKLWLWPLSDKKMNKHPRSRSNHRVGGIWDKTIEMIQDPQLLY